jgi:2-oxo-4-hydroxy-4-carboxy--5-ureidoimidazoline (OHCU) decarboxylase
MSIKTFLMRKMLASQMKGVPQADQDKIFAMLEKDPDLFQKIGLEVQEEMKKGRDQMSATMDVVKKYQAEIQKLM